MTIEDYIKMPSHKDRVWGGSRSVNLIKNVCDSRGEPLVSVVTVVLNGENHLEQTILSVLNQSYPNIEYIIIDGGSTDATLDIIQSYNNCLELWISEPDRGIYDAMNKGISLARGDYIKLLNADDLLVKNAIKRVINESYNLIDPEHTIISSSMKLINSDGKIIDNVSGEKKNLFWWSDMKCHPSWCVPKNVYHKHGLYSLNYRVASDRDFYFRSINNGIIFNVIPEALVEFRLNGFSQATKGSVESYYIHRQYFSFKKAFIMFLVHFFGKVRSNILLALFGERVLNKIRDIKRKVIKSMYTIN